MSGPHCFIGGSRHGIARNGVPMIQQDTYSRGPVEIGRDVWLDTGVCVLEGTRIGEGAVIGAGAVITKDTPPSPSPPASRPKLSANGRRGRRGG